MRERPFSAAAWAKLVNVRNVGVGSLQLLPVGIVKLHTENVTRSVPKNRVNTRAAAPPSMLWPESYSGVAPVAIRGVHVGSPSVLGFPSVSPRRTAVSGRQRL